MLNQNVWASYVTIFVYTIDRCYNKEIEADLPTTETTTGTSGMGYIKCSIKGCIKGYTIVDFCRVPVIRGTGLFLESVSLYGHDQNGHIQVWVAIERQDFICCAGYDCSCVDPDC